MANSYAYVHYPPQQWNGPHEVQRSYTDRVEKRPDDGDLVKGRIFWLPSKEELPERAVRRAHGKGAIEEGIYNHPIVITSRPAEEENTVHFHLITSLQGKKLNQLYSKSNEFHASRRSWYLAIAPTPEHPDATSKKTRKRFPTLELADGAILRWDSYVNIRHVYKIDWSLLRTYTNPNTPETQLFKFEVESMRRLLSKSRFLTMYEPGPQTPNLSLQKSNSLPIQKSTHITQVIGEASHEEELSSADAGSSVSAVYSEASTSPRLDFRIPNEYDTREANRPPKAPPDVLERLMTMSLDPNDMRRPFDRFLTNAKGVLAVTIASI